MRRRMFPLLFLFLLLPLTAAAWTLADVIPGRTIGFVPRAADNIGKQLDGQLLRLLAPSGYGRETVSIACTVPVDLGNFRHTSPLARQMAEELARYLVEQGYAVDELRKGNEVLMVRERGEFLLTRDVDRLQSRDVRTQLVLVGTYTVTSKSVRFNIRLLHAPGQEVVAVGAGTVPVTQELVPLLADSDAPPSPLQPTVRTRLPR